MSKVGADVGLGSSGQGFVATPWIRTILRVQGPRVAVDQFDAAAAGSGVIPWVLDLDQMEEDWFLPMATSGAGGRAISVAGARILAQRLRAAAAANHQRALARMAGDRSCPFDLHRLLPVPPNILALGPDDPVSRLWLQTHWGTPRTLRHVRPLPSSSDGRRRQTAGRVIEFWSADWSPWQALVRLRRTWPAITLHFEPDYGAAADG